LFPSEYGCIYGIIVVAIKPFSKGGKSILENFQTLCEECNLGKSDRIID